MNHEHNWVDVPVSLKGEVFGMEYQVSIKHCTICNLYDHTISLAGYSYEYFAMTAAPGVEGNFNKFCGVLILLLLGLSTLFTLRASAEEYTPPAEDSTQTVTDSEETHEVVQVQGVQTYDPTLYEKLDTMQESLNTLIDIMTPAETGTEDAQSGELVQDYTAQLETISGQLVDLRTAAEMATAETAQPAAFEKPFADYSVSEVLLLVLAAVVVGAIVIGLVRGF